MAFTKYYIFNVDLVTDLDKLSILFAIKNSHIQRHNTGNSIHYMR